MEDQSTKPAITQDEVNEIMTKINKETKQRRLKREALRRQEWKRWNATEAPTPNTYGVKEMYKGMLDATLEDGVDEDTYRALQEKKDVIS